MKPYSIDYKGNNATVETRTYGPLKPYVARITGTHPQYRLERSFCPKQDVTKHRSNVYRELEWVVKLEEDAVYQYRGLGGSSSGGNDGFWQVLDGKLKSITYADALQAAEMMEV